MNDSITTADLLDEYGSALRGSWGEIDGRSEKAALRTLSAVIRKRGNDPLSPEEISHLRDNLDVCPRGLGHWTEFCDDDCEETR